MFYYSHKNIFNCIFKLNILFVGLVVDVQSDINLCHNNHHNHDLNVVLVVQGSLTLFRHPSQIFHHSGVDAVPAQNGYM